ncbi:hypothetical protein FF38_06158 [Lucilia cuprina]|uniref:Uncharacterized protein n=1 Tax=Lucilia cuprina TaxID=7375 RepID=A0A0L0C6N6_LUCCU|nr:hypothetical protein CVS40_0436 [Lucilia cuprina]KNC27892.1 hypothetical protein FF38_06158 [Lucilia cuprina]
MPCKGCEKDCKCTTTKCDERCKCAQGNKCNCMSGQKETEGSGKSCCSKQTKSE